MRLFSLMIYLSAFFLSSVKGLKTRQIRKEICDVEGNVIESNNCVQFSVTSGTGCAWMCNYCASQLGTNNYYFTDNVCVYQQGSGCIGNPIAGKMYNCCSI